MLAGGDDVRLGAGLVSGGRGGAAGNDQNYHKVFIRTIYNGKKGRGNLYFVRWKLTKVVKSNSFKQVWWVSQKLISLRGLNSAK